MLSIIRLHSPTCTPGRAARGAAGCTRCGIRCGAQRPGARRRVVCVSTIRKCRLPCSKRCMMGQEAQNEVRLPARRAAVRLSAAWRHSARLRPSGHADDGKPFDTRGHRIPENPDGRVSDDGGAERSGRAPAARAAHPDPCGQQLDLYPLALRSWSSTWPVTVNGRTSSIKQGGDRTKSAAKSVDQTHT